MAVDVEKLKSTSPPRGMDFHIGKLGHVVLQVTDLERATDFYTRVLGFKVSDVYPEDMMPGGMVFSPLQHRSPLSRACRRGRRQE